MQIYANEVAAGVCGGETVVTGRGMRLKRATGSGRTSPTMPSGVCLCSAVGLKQPLVVTVGITLTTSRGSPAACLFVKRHDLSHVTTTTSLRGHGCRLNKGYSKHTELQHCGALLLLFWWSSWWTEPEECGPVLRPSRW